VFCGIFIVSSAQQCHKRHTQGHYDTVLSPHETVSVLRSSGDTTSCWVPGRMLLPPAEWNFSHEDGAAYSSKTVSAKRLCTRAPSGFEK